MNFIKEESIYFDNRSITKELCEDIVNIFNNNIINKKLCLDDHNHYSEIINTDYKSRILYFLNRELSFNLIAYLKQIISNNNNTCDIIDIINEKIKFPMCDTIFFIKKINLIQDQMSENKQKTLFSAEIIEENNKTFHFIWFLNDYNEEIKISADRYIKPRVGLFIIFPVSNQHLYAELNKINNVMNIIYGYIFNK